MPHTVELLLNIALLGAGMVALYAGGVSLIRGASAIALRFNVTPLVIGLTVVAFGTSAPELFVSMLAAIQGRSDVSVGNVVGSNVINVALVLGVASIIRPTPVGRVVRRFDGPFMFLSYALLAAAAASTTTRPRWIGGTISRPEGLLLVAVLIGYVLLVYRRAQNEPEAAAQLAAETRDFAPPQPVPLWRSFLLVVAGVVLLALGAEGLVRGASWIAITQFNASERFVGLAIVAFGTSLPELATTMISSSRGETDISVGNIVGSNIFNCLMVLGASAAIAPIPIGQTDFSGDLVFMVSTSLLLYVMAVAFKSVSRAGGVLLLGGYVAYLAFLIGTRTV